MRVPTCYACEQKAVAHSDEQQWSFLDIDPVTLHVRAKRQAGGDGPLCRAHGMRVRLPRNGDRSELSYAVDVAGDPSRLPQPTREIVLPEDSL
jgi:hypothetical protein